ncbi:alpha/beta-hydrolase [Delitschia confertaspora ATCC 74209]|uniref:Alpha/beta-hydrolase n=1 Tax=Delitschia confertaspora ATCC 74209 TaxID=1513339 RepID=A0A9P4MT12_9PLEO|nr:alpha/beta-hydrolase [Delitschia confertaspora ATCC 74209]
MASIKPFDPTIPEEEVDRLFRKLEDTRLPKEPVVPDAGEDYGPSLEWVHKLYNHWLHSFSWSEAQKTISSWNHLMTEIEELKIHFIHEKAKVRPEKAIPLLLVHGWPGTFYEFQNVMNGLLNPKNEIDPVFDLIVPSLPGFCWSSGPPRGWTLQDTARVYDTLLKRLGYTSYVAQAGDWGHYVVRELGSGRYPACKAVHTNMCPAPPPDVPKSEYTATEKKALQQTQWFVGKPKAEAHMGYAIEMRTRPQTVGVAFSDSPVGIMMWVGEKYNELADPSLGTATLESEKWKNDLCTTLCLYYFTSPSIMTSMLCYYNNVRIEDYAEFNQKEENLVKVPFGVTSFPYDSCPTSERMAKKTGNVKWYKNYDYGGHFCCMECPDEMVGDMRDFFGKYYKK